MPRSTDSRSRLIEAAKNLFYAHGYNSVGVKDICAHAGVNKGSFYHFFPSKRDLLLAVIDARAEWFGGVIQAAAGPELPPLQRVRRLFILIGSFDGEVRQQLGHVVGCPFGNLAAELSAQDDVIRRKIDGVFTAGIAFIEGQLQEALDNGEVEGVDTRAAAEAILAYLEGTHLLAVTRDSPELVAELADGALRLAGLRLIDDVEAGGGAAASDSRGG